MKPQSFLKGSLILGCSALLAKLLGALFKIPLTALLGGTGMGYFSCAYALFLPLYAVFVTGLSTAVARPVAGCAAVGDLAGALRIRSVARRLFLAVGTAAALLAAAAAKPFALYTAESAQAILCVLAIAPAVLFSCLTAVERGYHEGLCSMYPTAVSQAAEALCKLLCGLWLCHLVMELPELPPVFSGIGREGAAAAAAVLGVSISTAAGWLCTLAYSRPTGIKPAATPARDIIRTLLAVLLPVALGSLVTNLTSLIDLVTVMRICNDRIAEDAAGFYAGAHIAAEIPPQEASAFAYGSYMGLSMTVFNLIPSLTNMFAKGVLPCTAQAWARGERDAAAGLAGQVLVLTGIAAIPAGLGMFALPRGILEFLFSSRPAETAAAWDALRCLAPGVICLCLVFPIFSILQAIGRAGLPVRILCLGAAVKFCGNLLLVPRLYTVGAAISTTLSYAFILLLAVIALRRALGRSLQTGRAFLHMGYAGSMCAASAWLIYTRTLTHLPQRGALMLAVIGGGIVYAGISVFLMGEQICTLFRHQRSIKNA